MKFLAVIQGGEVVPQLRDTASSKFPSLDSWILDDVGKAINIFTIHVSY